MQEDQGAGNEFPSWSCASYKTTAQEHWGSLRWNLTSPLSNHLGINARFRSMEGNRIEVWTRCNIEEGVQPWVEIDTWTVEGCHVTAEGMTLQIQGIRDSVVSLDNALSTPADEVIAVFLGGTGKLEAARQRSHKLVCLLTQRVALDKQTVRRVGLLVITCARSQQPNNIELLQEHLRRGNEGSSLELKRRCVCII